MNHENKARKFKTMKFCSYKVLKLWLIYGEISVNGHDLNLCTCSSILLEYLIGLFINKVIKIFSHADVYIILQVM